MSRNRRAARRSGNWTQISALLLVLCAAVGSLVLWRVDPVLMQRIRVAQFDQMQRWHPRPYVQTAVRVVDIDEASLKAYGQGPGHVLVLPNWCSDCVRQVPIPLAWIYC